MTNLEYGLNLNSIGLLVNDNDYKKIKPYLDRLENGYLELLEENKALKKALNKVGAKSNLEITWDDVVVIKDNTKGGN